MTTKRTLAILGGTPLVDRADWPTWPPRSQAINDALLQVANKDEWGVKSKAVEHFELEFAREHDAQYSLAMANGSLALYAALLAVGVKPKDQVIIPGYTFMATAVSVIQAGATPVIVDVDPHTYNLDPAKAQAAITGKTTAIMPVHIGGNPADMNAFLKLGKEYNVHIIEDAAQAPGAIYAGKRVGAQGDVGCFSFQSSKNMTAGEGGILLTNSKAVYEKAFSVYNCGRTLDRPWYEHLSAGTNLRLSAFQAAILSAQLEHLEEDAQHREDNGKFLEAVLADIPGIKCAARYKQTNRNAYHLLIASYDAQSFNGLSKEKFMQAMLAEGIVVTDGYRPLNQLPFIEDQAQLPVTESICANQIWFRQFELLADRSLVEKIGEAVKNIQDQAHLIN